MNISHRGRDTLQLSASLTVLLQHLLEPTQSVIES
jgi:hypothetical protein